MTLLDTWVHSAGTNLHVLVYGSLWRSVTFIRTLTRAMYVYYYHLQLKIYISRAWKILGLCHGIVWGFWSSEMLHSVSGWFGADISGCPVDALCNSEQTIMYVYYYHLQPTVDIKRLCKFLGLCHCVVWGFWSSGMCVQCLSNLLLTFWDSMLMPSSNLLTLEGRTNTLLQNIRIKPLIGTAQHPRR